MEAEYNSSDLVLLHCPGFLQCISATHGHTNKTEALECGFFFFVCVNLTNNSI